jgi:hypothetical protein
MQWSDTRVEFWTCIWEVTGLTPAGLSRSLIQVFCDFVQYLEENVGLVH